MGIEEPSVRGKIVEKFLEDPQLILHNKNKNTHFNISKGTESAIDLSISSTCIADQIQWQVADDLYDSDHYPITISVDDDEITMPPRTPQWNFNKADWLLYQTEIEKSIGTQTILPNNDNKEQINEILSNFIQIIKKAANLSIPLKKNHDK